MSAWISVECVRPECPHECTTDETMVSQSVFVTDATMWPCVGMAHMRKDGTWKLYGGDYDFMHPENITHWMPLMAGPVA
jgi:hypothetical protein